MSEDREIIEVDTDLGLDRSLTLRDKLDFQYLIRRQVLVFQKALQEGDLNKIFVSIQALEAQTPLSWHDKDFQKDVKESELAIDIDIRPTCCGIRLNKEYCEANGIPTTRKQTFVDPIKRMHAIINLWDRLGYTSRRVYWEEHTGMPFDEFMKRLKEKDLLEESDEAPETPIVPGESQDES